MDLNPNQKKGIAKRFQKNKTLSIKWIKNSFLSEEYKKKYIILLEERYGILFEENLLI
jgi:serine/threonine-protein kinase HipA